MPKLHGQRPRIPRRRRSRPTRAANARTAPCIRRQPSMNEQDMADVAAYLAGPNVLTRVEERRAGRPSARRPAKSASPATAPTASASPPTTRRSAGQHARLHRARAARLPEGRPQEPHHGGHGRDAHRAGHRSSSRLTTRAQSARADRSFRRRSSSPRAVPPSSYFAASCFSRNVTMVRW